MPSTLPLPTISQLLRAGRNALRGEVDRYGDGRPGSVYDHVATGPMAILLSREADADRDAFRAIYWDDADGDDLTALVQGRLAGFAPATRILDAQGTGLLKVSRTSTTAGGGTFWAGTRYAVGSTLYEVSSDTTVSATATSASVPINALSYGPGVAIDTPGGVVQLDPLWDSWTVTRLTCADGTTYESADAYRARVRAALLNARNGYLPAMLAAAKSAGATYLVAFDSTYGLPVDRFVDSDYSAAVSNVTLLAGLPGYDSLVETSEPHGLSTGQYVTIAGVEVLDLATPVNGTWPISVRSPTAFAIPPAIGSGYLGGGTVLAGATADYGLNAAYVADAEFGSSAALVNAARIALEGVRVLGADLWVGGIAVSPLSISANVTLVADPVGFDLPAIQRQIVAALLGYFGPSGAGYSYKLAAMAGAMHRASGAVQSVSFAAPTSDVVLSPSAWPDVLTRYSLRPGDVTLNFLPPS